jgi:hypothetical protein
MPANRTQSVRKAKRKRKKTTHHDDPRKCAAWTQNPKQKTKKNSYQGKAMRKSRKVIFFDEGTHAWVQRGGGRGWVGGRGERKEQGEKRPAGRQRATEPAKSGLKPHVAWANWPIPI